MKKYLLSGITLFAICASFALLLSIVNMLTAPTIKRNAEKRIADSLSVVNFEDAVVDMEFGEQKVEDDTVNSYYRLNTEDGVVKGYILNLTGKGYGGKFTLLASYESDGTLYMAKLLDNSETSGMGKKYEDDSNIAIFSAYPSIPTTKGSLSAEHSSIVSGASVTFQGIGVALQTGQKFVVEVLNGGNS